MLREGIEKLRYHDIDYMEAQLKIQAKIQAVLPTSFRRQNPFRSKSIEFLNICFLELSLCTKYNGCFS